MLIVRYIIVPESADTTRKTLVGELEYNKWFITPMLFTVYYNDVTHTTVTAVVTREIQTLRQ